MARRVGKPTSSDDHGVGGLCTSPSRAGLVWLLSASKEWRTQEAPSHYLSASGRVAIWRCCGKTFNDLAFISVCTCRTNALTSQVTTGGEGIGKLTGGSQNGDRNRLLHDGEELRLQLRGKGRGSWIYRFQLKGRMREMGLGTFPEVTLAEARQRAADAAG